MGLPQLRQHDLRCRLLQDATEIFSQGLYILLEMEGYPLKPLPQQFVVRGCEDSLVA